MNTFNIPSTADAISQSAKKPVTFLTLPRELRQKIIIDSLDPVSYVINPHNPYCPGWGKADKCLTSILDETECEHSRDMRQQISTLTRVHPFAEDVAYAKKIWMETHEKQVEEVRRKRKDFIEIYRSVMLDFDLFDLYSVVTYSSAMDPIHPPWQHLTHRSRPTILFLPPSLSLMVCNPS